VIKIAGATICRWTKGAEQFEAVRAGKRVVDDQAARPLVVDATEQLIGIRKGPHGIPFDFQDELQRVADSRIVVDDEDGKLFGNFNTGEETLGSEILDFIRPALG
jgi:hypothetical protein